MSDEDDGDPHVRFELERLRIEEIVADATYDMLHYVKEMGLPLLEHFDRDSWTSLVELMMDGMPLAD